MVRYIIFIIASYLIGIPIVSSQYGYNKAISLPEHKRLNFDDLILEEDGIIVAGNIFIDSIGLWGVYFGKFDTVGNLLWNSCIIDPQRTSHLIQNTPTRLTKANDGGYLIPMGYYNRGTLGLCKIDAFGNIVFIKEYKNLEPSILPFSITEARGNYYISGWIQRVNLGTDVFLLRINSIGDVDWIKYFGTLEYEELSGDLSFDNNNVLSIGGVVFPPNYNELGFEGRWTRPWILSVDLNGEFVSEWKGLPNDSRAKAAGGLTHSPNGDWGLIYIECKIVKVGFSDRIYCVPAISVLDSNYNLKWKRTYGEYSSTVNSFIGLDYDTIRNEWVAIGQIARQNKGAGIVVKYTQDGEILWANECYLFNETSIEAGHWMGGLAISSSGSIYTAGHVEYSNPPFYDYGWILKVTPDGCIDTLCTTTSILDQLNLSDKLSLYPNPARQVVTVKTSVGFTSFRILDLSGKVRITEDYFSDGLDHSINVSKLNSGMYIMQILDEKKQISMVKLIVTD